MPAGRKPSADPTSQMAIYPPRSLRERLDAQARRLGEKPAQYALEGVRQRIEKDEAGDVGERDA